MPGNGVELIKNDHRQVEQLFAQIKASNDIAVKRQTARTIITEVSKHSVAEEQIMYPLFRNLTGDDKTTDHSIHEHAEVAKAMAELEEIKTVEQFQERCNKLEASLQHPR